MIEECHPVQIVQHPNVGGDFMAISQVRKIRAPKIGRDSNGRLMTPEEFDKIRHFDGRRRYELINGVFIVSPIPSSGERGSNDELYHILRSYQTGRAEGGALDGTLPEEYIHLPDGRRRADRVI